MASRQKSLARVAHFTGKGLHSGRIVKLEVHPASANYGIRFLRTDTEQAEIVRASYANISATELCTVIGSAGNSVSTIEHLMAALAGLGVDNALVRIDGPEVPILDGSSKLFVEKFMQVGICELAAQRKSLKLLETFEFRSGDRWVRMEPANETSFHCEINFSWQAVGHQTLDFKMTENGFLCLANARTFCHINEVNAMRSVGLAQGGSLENAVVVADTGILNEDGLRSPDEFVRHKLLDLIGDLALLGAPLIAKITISKPGHGFHGQIMNLLMKNKRRYFGESEESLSSQKAAMAESLALVGGV